MPTFIRISNGDNYRTKGEHLGFWTRLKLRLGLIVEFTEDPSGNRLYINGRMFVHGAVISEEMLAAVAARQQAEPERRIVQPVETIPSRRRHH